MPGPFSPPFSGDEFMRRLGALPLAIAPGKGWLYHTGIDALSVLLSRATGRPVSALLQDGSPGHCRCAIRRSSPISCIVSRPPTARRASASEVLDLPRGRFSRPPRFEAFGSGLVSTVPDFLTFLECLLDDGGDVLGATRSR